LRISPGEISYISIVLSIVLLSQAGNLESDYLMQDEMIPQGPHIDESSFQPLPSVEGHGLREYHENSFLAVVYPDKSRASKVLKALKKVKAPKLIDLENAVYVTRDKRGSVQLRELGFRRKKNTIGDSITGLVAGSLLLTPVDGATLADATDTIRHKVASLHIEDSFTLELRAQLQPDSSAIFLLIQKAFPDEVIPRITPYGGTILETLLTPQDKTQLEKAIKAGRVH
jgi:uncharacterized membrane protein